MKMTFDFSREDVVGLDSFVARLDSDTVSISFADNLEVMVPAEFAADIGAALMTEAGSMQ